MPVIAIGENDLPPADELKLKYYYCAKSGVLYIKDKYFKIVDGKPQGNMITCKNIEGYNKVTLMGRTVLTHRLVWAIYYGKWPDINLQIDHINRVKDDNRISNLRLVTAKENSQNKLPYKRKKRGKYKKRGGGQLGA